MLTYAVRHAESLANAGRDDRLDSPLSELGIAQVAALLDRFRTAPLAAIYSSPYRRCLDTAEPIARALGLPVRLRPEPCEFHHRPTAGQADSPPSPEEAVAARRGTVVIDPDLTGPLNWPPLEETPEQLVVRMASLAAALQARWPGDDDAVLLISHGSPIARFIDAWLSDDRSRSFRYIIDNAALTALRCNAEVSSLICLNETSHLRGLAAAASANFDDQGLIKPHSPGAYW